MVVHASELQVLSAARRTGLTLDFVAGIASYLTETDDTVTYDAPAGYRVESDDDLIHRAKGAPSSQRCRQPQETSHETVLDPSPSPNG